MKMRYAAFIGSMAMLFFFSATPAPAHFGMVIPSDSMVMQSDERKIDIDLSFSHPFERIGMELEKPEAFLVISGEKTEDLTRELAESGVMGAGAWQLRYPVRRPGAYHFVMTPKPYWEPVEDVFIIHYTRSVVAAFGDDSGWDRELGLPTEIVPLVKPFGQYAGNVFQGVVKVKGKPAPYAEVEVEHYNQGKKVSAPTEYMICQTIKADRNGVFTYAAPAAGWWGFAALNTADYQMEHRGEEKDVELGAVLWVRFHPWDDNR
jgi:cobalt/nickel transport protein